MLRNQMKIYKILKVIGDVNGKTDPGRIKQNKQ